MRSVCGVGVSSGCCECVGLVLSVCGVGVSSGCCLYVVGWV